MAVKTHKSVIYHIPKCAGIWVKEAVRRSGIEYGRCRSVRAQRGVAHPFGLSREHSTPDNTAHVDGLYSFCFVRHPAQWYKSFFAYRYKSGHLDHKFPPDRVWNKDFNTFVHNVIDEHGDFVTQLYQYFVGSNCDKVDFIGKQESVVYDLITALNNAGETFDEDIIRNARRRNVVASSKKYKSVVVLNKETKKRILKTEQWIMENFYARS